MRKLLCVMAALLMPVAAFAGDDFSMAEAHLVAAYGGKVGVETVDGARQATAFSADGRQAVRLTGPADAYTRAEAQVDLRPANAAKGRAFLVEAARTMLAKDEWPAAERFVDQKLGTLAVGEKARHQAVGRSLELERSSDVMARLVVTRGR